MKVTEILKNNLIKLVNMTVIQGNPDSKEFQQSLEQYNEMKAFVESLEVEHQT